MSIGGWSCPHYTGEICPLIRKDCDPGDKGCVLYGKVKFTDPTSPSNTAFDKRQNKKERRREK